VPRRRQESQTRGQVLTADAAYHMSRRTETFADATFGAHSNEAGHFGDLHHALSTHDAQAQQFFDQTPMFLRIHHRTTGADRNLVQPSARLKNESI
jgi:hypothetical protein